MRDHLSVRGREVLLVREPGGTPLGRRIREMLLDPSMPEPAPVTEALLFAADRAQQVRDVIIPALRKGTTVIADRYVDSSLAYQGVGRGCGLETVRNLNDWATGSLEPDLTIFLEMSVRDGLARARDAGPDRIELESVEFHENVRQAYGILRRLYSYRYVVVDATGTPEAVHERVVEEADRILV